MSASPLAARMSPTPEPKKPVIQEEFTGYGKTELIAQKDALRRACEWLEKESGLGWSPDANYLTLQKMADFGPPEDKEFEEPMGTMKVVKMQLKITDSQLRDIQKQVQHLRMKDRQKTSLLALLGAMGLIGVVGGYLRLEEATKGYYTRLLRIAAICFVVVIVAGLCVVG